MSTHSLFFSFSQLDDHNFRRRSNCMKQKKDFEYSQKNPEVAENLRFVPKSGS